SLMILVPHGLVGLALLFPLQQAPSGRKQPALTDYQKALQGLTAETLRAGLPADRMLDLCVPTSKRVLGRFTEYGFELLPGYHGLALVAKDGLLRRAIEWSCTYTRTYFNELTPDEDRQYRAVRERNAHVPSERHIGRWGWDRPPRRLWDRDLTVPGGSP